MNIVQENGKTWSSTVLGSRKKNALSLELFLQHKSGLISSYIHPIVQIQRGTFSSFSMRNRGILIKSLVRAGAIESKDLIGVQYAAEVRSSY